MEGKTQQQCGLELQLMNSVISVAPKIAEEVNETTNSMGLIHFWMQFFEPEANCPITYQSDVYLIYYYQMLAGREKTQPNNNKTPPNPDQENQEPLKACASTSKPANCLSLVWQYQTRGSLSGSNSALVCTGRNDACTAEGIVGWLASPVDFRQNSGLLDLITAEELIRGTNTYQLIV